jgi:hypothetical protein
MTTIVCRQDRAHNDDDLVLSKLPFVLIIKLICMFGLVVPFDYILFQNKNRFVAYQAYWLCFNFHGKNSL